MPDGIGAKATDIVQPIHDVPVSLRHLPGQDNSRVMFFHGGRFRQLSQSGGEKIPVVVG